MIVSPGSRRIFSRALLPFSSRVIVEGEFLLLSVNGSHNADTKAIRVVRTVDGKQTELPFDYHAVLKGTKSSENILLEPGDTIIVPE